MEGKDFNLKRMVKTAALFQKMPFDMKDTSTDNMVYVLNYLICEGVNVKRGPVIKYEIGRSYFILDCETNKLRLGKITYIREDVIFFVWEDEKEIGRERWFSSLSPLAEQNEYII